MNHSKSIFCLCLIIGTISNYSCIGINRNDNILDRKIISNVEPLVVQDSKIGKITGIIKDNLSNTELSDVTVLVNAKGNTFSVKTETDGSFILNIENINKGEGYNIHFIRDGYKKATKAGIFRIPDLQIELEPVKLHKMKTIYENNSN